jgi:ATP-dependent helicase/nuclease subunit B
MTAIANIPQSLQTPQSPDLTGHPGDVCWAQAMAQLAASIETHGAHPSQTVVLVPYAQLMQQARSAWAAHTELTGKTASFVPRFETTMNWASTFEAGADGDFVPASEDIQMDTALDALTAVTLLERAGLGAQQAALAGRLVESSWAIARLAAAQAPAQRLAWGVHMAARLGVGLESPLLAFELAVGRIALAWAAASSYPTDVLFSRRFDLLVVLGGFQSEPVVESLKTHFSHKAVTLKLAAPPLLGALSLHAAQDAEDEAHRAAACVIAHLQQGRSPVALIAQDRVLTRRIRAMLAGRGIALRDETGWKLSTTRAAATLMSLLRAMSWDASADAVLDWLKNAPAFDASQVTLLEIELRKAGVRFWRALPARVLDSLLVTNVTALRGGLQRARLLTDWLIDLRAALQASHQWEPLASDAAGSAALAALRLDEGSDVQFASGTRMSLQDFTSWINQTLEAASFAPEHPPEAQVVILPLSQLLGRPMQAVVLPGADEVRLAVSPEPPGMWTPGQREVLGLPSRAELAAAQRQAWDYALHMPHIDVLWRTSEGGEALMPSGCVQEVLLKLSPLMAADPRIQREVAAQPTPHPMPQLMSTGNSLLNERLTRLSASAYEDLRRCPYRFFALRLLKLQESEELESELGKREFGNWLHTLLRSFHEALKTAVDQSTQARLAMINIAAESAANELGLTDSEFLPFAAIWPRVRDGYLDWLAGHEASGAQFLEGEVWKKMPYGNVTLFGKLDRIDQLPDGAGGSALVMDYKTEASNTTKARIKEGPEDTQLAFYAALLADDTLAAAYVNLGEKEPTKTYGQPEIVHLRDGLIESILSDVSRIASGAPMPALGEGKACEYCSARGMCRKDFWQI